MWLQHSSPFLNNFSSISFWAKSPYWHCSRFPEHRRIKRQNVVPFSNITKLHRVWWCFLFRAQVVFVIQIFPTDAYWFVLQIFLGVLYCSKYSTKTLRIVSKARGCNILQYIIPPSFCLTWLHTKCAQAISQRLYVLHSTSSSENPSKDLRRSRLRRFAWMLQWATP